MMPYRSKRSLLVPPMFVPENQRAPFPRLIGKVRPSICIIVLCDNDLVVLMCITTIFYIVDISVTVLPDGLDKPYSSLVFRFT